MSVLNYDGPRRVSRKTSARTFPQTYYSERSVALDFPRAGPYAYSAGGPVCRPRNQLQPSRAELPPEHGGARRRASVAVSLSSRSLLRSQIGELDPLCSRVQESVVTCLTVRTMSKAEDSLQRGHK